MIRVLFCLTGLILFLVYIVTLYPIPAKGPIGPMPTGAKIITETPENIESRFDNDNARQCLSINTYYEARNQSMAGQLATMHVVINRVKSQRFPDTICGVITEGPTYTNWLGNEWPVRDRCQFSWYCDGLSDIPTDATTFFKIQELVDEFLNNNTIDFTDGALYYHSDYVEPEWKDDYTVTTVIDNHTFYN